MLHPAPTDDMARVAAAMDALHGARPEAVDGDAIAARIVLARLHLADALKALAAEGAR